MKCFLTGLIAIFMSYTLAAQPASKPALPAEKTPMQTALAAVAAHGGDKLLKMKTLVMKGSLDLNVFNQPTAAAFSIALSGDKYLFEVNSPIQPLRQVFDGSRTSSSIHGFSLPPVTSLGFPVLQKVGDTGHPVSALPEGKKKRNGFRITTPEGFYTDFIVDEKTGRVKSYESSYEISGRVVTTAAEIDDYLTVEGVVVPKKYSQRFDLGNMTAYANFNAKTILVNQPIDDSVFVITK